jgi:hypothetical protein
MTGSFAKWVTSWAALGLVVAVGWTAVQWFIGSHEHIWKNVGYLSQRVMRVMWPSSVWLMATDGIEGTPTDYFFVVLSALANVVLYGAVGAFIWMLRRIAHRR